MATQHSAFPAAGEPDEKPATTGVLRSDTRVTSGLLPTSHKPDQLLKLKYEEKFAKEYCWLPLRPVPSADDAPARPTAILSAKALVRPRE